MEEPTLGILAGVSARDKDEDSPDSFRRISESYRL